MNGIKKSSNTRTSSRSLERAGRPLHCQNSAVRQCALVVKLHLLTSGICHRGLILQPEAQHAVESAFSFFFFFHRQAAEQPAKDYFTVAGKTKFLKLSD